MASSRRDQHNNNNDVNDDQMDDNYHNEQNGNSHRNVGDVPLIELASNEIEQMRIQRRQQRQQQLQTQQNLPNTDIQSTNLSYHTFPTACLSILKSIEGNSKCIDCNERNPQWAAVRYGAMVCLKCSGHHRSLGVSISTIRSITMDEWTFEEILCMLEGGNAQLSSFFSRHALTHDADPPVQSSALSTTASSSSSTALVPNSTVSTISTNMITNVTTIPQTIATTATAASTSIVPTSSNTNSTNVITKENVIRMRYKTKAALFYRKQLEIHIANVLNSGPYRGREISRRLKHHPLDKRNSTLE
jgi:Putative GTPase activating protein for Arf